MAIERINPPASTNLQIFITNQPNLIMQVTVTIPDHFIEEESLHDAVKQSIITEIVYSIKKNVKDQVETEISAVVRAFLVETVKAETSRTIAEFTESGTILVSGKMVPVKEHLKGIFEDRHAYNNVAVQVKDHADKWGKELKAKYDGAFVTQLVHRIDLAGLLKPEVAKLLLGDESKA